MSISADKAVAALLAARESWCEVEPGRRLRVRRPVEAQITDLRRGGVRAYCDCVVAWDGFTASDVLGPEAGADALPCDGELVYQVLADRTDWVGALVEHLAARLREHAEASEARRKNSSPS